MERKEVWIKVGYVRFFCAVIVIMLCAAPYGWAVDIIEPELGPIFAYGEVNVYADITYGLFANPGSTVNIYAGAIGDGVSFGITVSPGATVTVHGTNFGGDGNLSVPGQVSFSTGSGILTVTYTDDTGNPIGDPVNLLFLSDTPINLVDTAGGPEPEPITVQIDIKPGSNPNPINQGSNGIIPVAILTTDSFDASTVDPGTVTLAGAEVAVRGKSEKLMARLEDVDSDGDDDLMLQVDTQSEGAVWEAGPVTLLGTTYEGQAIEGTDSVVIVPPQ
jgi:hypothetical protein